MGSQGVTSIWVVDGLVRYPEATLSAATERAAEAAVDALGALAMVAVVDVRINGAPPVVRTDGVLNEVGSAGPIAQTLSAPLKRAMSIRPRRHVSPRIAPTTMVLLAARLRSRGSEGAVEEAMASLAGAVVPECRSIIRSLVSDGLLKARGEPGRISLTSSGAERLATELAVSVSQSDRDAIESVYRHFLAVNGEFLAAVSSWQVGPRGTDRATVSGMRSLVNRLAPLLVPLAEVLPRFAGYLPRFDRALGRSGERVEWLDSPMVDSVHTVWFELHEHLLATLGRTRTDEH